MNGKKQTFKDYPDMVKYGITLVIFSWVFFIASQAVYTGKISVIHLTMGMFVSVLAYSLKRWGRIFTIVYNLIISGFIGIEVYIGITANGLSGMHDLVKVLSMIFFIVSAAFLGSPRSAAFYREHGV